MFYPKTNYAKIAYDAILFFVTTGQVKKVDESKITADLKLNRACLVSVYDSNDNQICAYGDIEPTKDNLYEEILENAIGAVKIEDSSEITADMLSQIKVYVDVLSVPNEVSDFSELKPQKHGLFIKNKEGKTGYILPNIKGIKTVEKQIETLKERTGITNDFADLDIKSFKVTRYD